MGRRRHVCHRTALSNESDAPAPGQRQVKAGADVSTSTANRSEKVSSIEVGTQPRAFFTERTLAEYLSVSDRTVRDWIRHGKLPSYKLGGSRRIDPTDVDAFLAARRQNGRTA
jgi:excisionase family DNA binding protein